MQVGKSPSEWQAPHAHTGLQEHQHIASVHQRLGDRSIKMVDKQDALDALAAAQASAACKASCFHLPAALALHQQQGAFMMQFITDLLCIHFETYAALLEQLNCSDA